MDDKILIEKSTISRAIADFDGIQDAIVEKGVPVPSGTPTSEYGDKIRSISGGGDSPLTGYAEIDFPVELQTGTLYSFLSSKGEMFFSSSAANIGIWRINKELAVVEQVHALGYNHSTFYESELGDIFVASPTNSADTLGLLKWNGATFDKVHPTGYAWTAKHESKSGDLFFTGTGDTGIYRWDGSTFAQVHTTANGANWFESKSGDIFINGNTASNASIYRWDGAAFERVYSGGYNWNLYEDNQGNIFAGGRGAVAASAGILKWDGAAFERVYSDSYGWGNFYEDSAGNVFASSTVVSSISKWNGTTFEPTSGVTGSSWVNGFEDSGNLFVTSSGGTGGGTGILKWDGTTFEKVYDVGHSWAPSHKSKSGELFFTSSNTASVGILKWDGTVFVQVHDVGSVWANWFEDDFGNLFLSSTSSTAAYLGIWKWNGTTFDRVRTTGYDWRNWAADDQGDVFVSSSVSSYAGVLTWDGSTFASVYPVGYNWRVRDDRNLDKVTLSNDMLQGELEYDGEKFVIKRFYSGKPFGAQYTMYSDATTLGVIFKGKRYAGLTRHYATTPVSSGDYAYALSSTKDKILYV